MKPYVSHLLIALSLVSFLSAHARAETPPLSSSDRRMLANGEIGVRRWISGVALGTFVGFGSGQAVEHRYRWHGLVDSIGEGAGVFILLVGVEMHANGDPKYDPSAANNGMADSIAKFGGVWLGVFRLLSTIDVAVGPHFYNKRLEELKASGALQTVSPVLLRERFPGLGLSWNY